MQQELWQEQEQEQEQEQPSEQVQVRQLVRQVLVRRRVSVRHHRFQLQLQASN